MISLKNKKVLIIAPHQDDEIVGCGGIIQKILQHEGKVFVAFATFSPDEFKKFDIKANTYFKYEGKIRHEEMIASNRYISSKKEEHILLEEPLFGNEKHLKLDTLPIIEICSKIEKRIKEHQPDILLVPAKSFNQDHNKINEAIETVMRPHFFNGTVLEYEVAGEKEFIPDLFIELTEEEVQKKAKAFEIYESQNSGENHIVSSSAIINKSKSRGYLSNFDYAEAFKIKRMVLEV